MFMRFLCFVLLGTTLSGCGGGSGSSNSQAATDTSASSPTDDEASIDITNAVFESREVDCAEYDNQYASAVVDVNRSIGFNGSLAVAAGSETCVLTSNVIPNHDFNDDAMFATPTSEQILEVVVPRNPTLAGRNTALSHGLWDGIMLNGVVIDVLSAGCWNGAQNTPAGCSDDNDWLINPLTSDGFFAHDTHHAHTQPDGTYHYHGEPLAMYDDFPGPEGSPVIGFAADGFPIYGPYFFDQDTGQVREALSGYTLKTEVRDATVGPGGIPDGFYNSDWEWTDAGDLDECNGMTVDGQYGYYVTRSYPHTMRCFKGIVDGSFGK